MTQDSGPLADALAGEMALRAEQRPPSRYWYPLTTVTYDLAELLTVCDALLDQQTTMGPRVAAFEQRFAAMHGVDHAIMVNSGSSADLLAAFLLVDPRGPRLRAGDEVLVPAVTWPTQVTSLLMAGLSVTLVDVDPETLQVDLDDLEAKIGPRTRAVSVVHLMGNTCNMERLDALCRRRELVLLEDCCEALGARWRGRLVGTFGLASAFSFFFSHHITTMEGGMVLCADADAAETLRLLRAHGWTRGLAGEALHVDGVDPRYTFVDWGFNVRPPEVAGAFGGVQLDKLDGFMAARRANAAALVEALAPFGDLIRPMRVEAEVECSWFALPLMVQPGSRLNVSTLKERLEQAGVETRPIVAGNLARQPMAELFPQLNVGDVAGAESIHEHGFYVGIHPTANPDLTARLADELVDAIRTEADLARDSRRLS